MGSVPILFTCSIVISLLISVAGYPEKCYQCGTNREDLEGLEKCYTSPSLSPIQKCSAAFSTEDPNKFTCASIFFKKDGKGYATRDCMIEDSSCNTVREVDGTSLTANCCDTDLCNGASKTMQDLSIFFVLLILLATLNNVLARV